MFERCHKCGQGGLECKDDYASLKSGYWWEWRNQTHKVRYINFTKNLLASLPALDVFQVQYPYPVPIPHKCPREESCRGGFDSSCENGYEGPLCAICSSRYYKQLQRCRQCPSKQWIVGQLSIITVILLITIVFLVWRSKNETKRTRGRPFINIILCKLKIVIGFYQVTYGLLETFSYVKWPDNLQVIAKYSGILQLNVLQIAPIHCLFPGLHVNAFGSLFAIMAINATAIVFSGVAYRVRKMIIVTNKSLEKEEKSTQVSQTKEIVYRNLFFVMYVTYLSTCSKTANVLPLACRDLCRNEKEEMCYSYLKADYTIKCQGQKYNHLLPMAYISTAYIIALPLTLFTFLWRQRTAIFARNTGTSRYRGSSTEVMAGLSFTFENYKTHSWYWELVEMSRKVILTSGLILVGEESRSYIGLTWVIAGMYGVLFAWIKPIQDTFENRLMTTSLAVTIVNLAIGAVSRIPAENLPAATDSYMDAVVFKILVIGANTLVVGLLIGKP